MKDTKKGCSVVAHKASKKKDKHTLLSACESILDFFPMEVKLVIFSTLFLGLFSQMAYNARGYVAFGGEVILAFALGCFCTWVTE